MQLRELLLEYDRSKTMDRYGEVLYQRMRAAEAHPDSIAGKLNFKALQLAISYAMDNHLTSDDDERDQVIVADLSKSILIKLALEHIEEADPTPTKEYLPWILTRYIKGGIARFEDIGSTVADLLSQYDAAKRSGYFRRQTDPEIKALADIGRFKDLKSLFEFVRSLQPKDVMSNNAAERAKEQEFINSKQVEILYNDSRIKIMKLLSQEAAMFFGRNTQWCTAAKRNNLYSRYAKQGPLILVLDKAENKRWQLHFQSGQFMDETDTPVRWDDASLKQNGFPSEIWGLLDWRPLLKGLDREGCIHMLQTLPEDYLDDILHECDATAIVVAYPQIGKGWRRDLIRGYVVENYAHAAKPAYSENKDGIEIKVWTGHWPMDNAMMSEIIREEWSPIWENTYCGRDAISGDVVGALDLAMKPMSLFVIGTAGDTPVYIQDANPNSKLRSIRALWPVENSITLRVDDFKAATYGFFATKHVPLLAELFKRVCRYL